MSIKDYLDKALAEMALDPNWTREPDCFIIHRLDALRIIVGQPLAIFRLRQSLYDQFEAITNSSRCSVIPGVWWFDDKV